MNSYFCNIGSELSKKIQPPDSEIKLQPINPRSRFITQTNINRIKNIITKMELTNDSVGNINTKSISFEPAHIQVSLYTSVGLHTFINVLYNL